MLIPQNESGLVVLFSSVADVLGYEIIHAQMQFPDLTLVEKSTGRIIRAEAELYSRTFYQHKHPENGCDLIICWINNWPECKIETIALVDLLPSEQAKQQKDYQSRLVAALYSFHYEATEAYRKRKQDGVEEERRARRRPFEFAPPPPCNINFREWLKGNW